MVGWRLCEAQRRSLLLAFPPRYARVLAEEVALAPQRRTVPLPVPSRALVVGEMNDERSLQALMICVQGYVERPGGGLFPMVWSAAPERPLDPDSVEAAIAASGWRPTALLPIQLTPI